MNDTKKNTLCELIDAIVLNSGNCRTNPNVSELVKELSTRLDLSYTSTILFSNIFWKSCRGEFPSKSEILPVIAGESTAGIYLAIQELYKKDYIKSFRTSPRRPYLCFYTMEELDRKIINNELPYFKRKLEEETISKILLKPIANSNDYQILLNDVQIGIIYFNLSELNIYTAVVNDNMVTEGNNLNEIEIEINKLLKENESNR